MLFPKIQRNSMLPMMCSSPPCMNIAVKIVKIVGGEVGSQALAAGSRGHALLARVGDLEGDRRVLDRELVADRRPVQREVRLLEEEEHDHVDRDQHDRDDREPPRRDVVLDRQQRPIRVSAAPPPHSRTRSPAGGRPRARRPGRDRRYRPARGAACACRPATSSGGSAAS